MHRNDQGKDAIITVPRDLPRTMCMIMRTLESFYQAAVGAKAVAVG